jgi:hypothetical protein
VASIRFLRSMPDDARIVDDSVFAFDYARIGLRIRRRLRSRMRTHERARQRNDAADESKCDDREETQHKNAPEQRDTEHGQRDARERVSWTIQ